MSFIHKALSKTQSSERNVSASFNPLHQQRAKKNHHFSYYAVGLFFLLATGFLVFLPKKDLPNLNDPTQVSALPTPTKQTMAGHTLNQNKSTETHFSEPPITPNLTEDANNPTSDNADNGMLRGKRPIINQAAIKLTEGNDVAPNDNDEQQSDNVASNTYKPENKNVAPTAVIPKKTTPTTNTSTSTNTSSTTSVITNTPNKTTAPTLSSSQSTSMVKPSGNTNTNTVITHSKNLWQQQITQAVNNGELEKAKSYLKQWISASPADPTPRTWLAKIYINDKLYTSAEPLLTTLTEQEPQALLGIVYERTSRPALAAKTFEALFRSSPTESKWLLFWAINSEKSGQLAKSRILYQNYIQTFSDVDMKLTQFAAKRLSAMQGQ